MDILKQLALVSLLTAFGCTSASSPDGGSGTATNETSSSASSGSSSGSTGSSSLSSSGTGTTRTSSATSASGGSGGSGISGTTTSSGACPTTGVSSSSTGGGGIPSTSYGSCTKDLDCPGCGWVCSWSLGHICVPAMKGDPGWCSTDCDCACAGQTCLGNRCTPAPRPPCACNSDCPSGQVCDQLAFTCAPQPQGASCDPNLPGACGCGFHCQNGSCVPTPQAVPECLTDVDCNTCGTGSICAIPDAGFPAFCEPAFDGGWCP